VINDNAFVSAAMADVWSMVDLVCFFYENAPASISARYLDLVHCAYLHKLSACMRTIIAFYQHLLRLIIKSAVLADILVKPKYRPDISARPVYQSILKLN